MIQSNTSLTAIIAQKERQMEADGVFKNVAFRHLLKGERTLMAAQFVAMEQHADAVETIQGKLNTIEFEVR